MQNLIAHWFVAALALIIVAYILPGFHVKSFGKALIAAAIIACANVLVRPVLLFFAIPLTILTFGLFVWVVNAIVLRLCAMFTPGFDIDGWFSAIFGAVLLSIVSSMIFWLAGGL